MISCKELALSDDHSYVTQAIPRNVLFLKVILPMVRIIPVNSDIMSLCIEMCMCNICGSNDSVN